MFTKFKADYAVVRALGWMTTALAAIFCFCMAANAEEPVFKELPPYAGDGRRAPAPVRIEIRELIIPPQRIPGLEIPTLDVKAIGENGGAEIPQLRIPSIQQEIDKIHTPERKALLKRIADTRSALDGRLFSLGDDAVKSWLAIYREGTGSIAYIEPPKGVRMIAEVRMPRSEEQARILRDNLNYRHGQGFNAVLLTFDGSETVGDLTDLAAYLRRGFKVWFAFGGREDLKVSVFLDPETYGLYLQSLARVCDGFLSHWRRTSSHLFIQDDAFMYYTAVNVRAGNPNIPVLGEVYYGETAAISSPGAWYDVKGRLKNHAAVSLVVRMAAGGSGYVVTNLGAPGIDASGVTGGLLKPIQGAAKYVLISGPRPYFLTTHRSDTSYEEDLRGIEAIERRWLRAGAYGTIVTHADGTDSQGVTDNMSEYSYRLIKPDVKP